MTQPMLAEAVAPVERVLPLDRSGDIALLTAALDRLESLPVVDGRVRFSTSSTTMELVASTSTYGAVANTRKRK